jgi:5-methylcytosine-specific restriction protein A
VTGKWEHSTRRQRLPADWHKRRTACYRNAQGRCEQATDGQRCTTVTPLHRTDGVEAGHADHIDREGDDTQLQWLCPAHHRAKTTLEGAAALPRERRVPEPHPGLA